MSDQPAERANIHEARLAQESLQYQPRQGSEALALVYQIVGCYLLATSALSILQTTATLLVVPGTITLPLGAQYTVANVDWLVVMAGAIAMLRLRSWGAMCVLLGESLKFAGSLPDGDSAERVVGRSQIDVRDTYLWLIPCNRLCLPLIRHLASLPQARRLRHCRRLNATGHPSAGPDNA